LKIPETKKWKATIAGIYRKKKKKKASKQANNKERPKRRVSSARSNINTFRSSLSFFAEFFFQPKGPIFFFLSRFREWRSPIEEKSKR